MQTSLHRPFTAHRIRLPCPRVTTRKAVCSTNVQRCPTLPSGTAATRLAVVPLHAHKVTRRTARQTATVKANAVQEVLTSVAAFPSRDVAAFAFSVAGAYVWVKLFHILTANGILEQKLSRKLVHISSGPLFMLCWPLFSADPSARFIAATVPLLNALRLALIGFGVVDDSKTVAAVSREGDRAELLRGPLYYVLVLTLVTLLYWRESPVGFVVLSLMCGGDGLADIVGRRFGTEKLPHNPNKSWAGSCAMFSGGFAMCMGFLVLYKALGYLDFNTPSTALTIAGISLAATIIESLPINTTVDDNLSVPGVAAFMGYMMLIALG